MKKKKVSKRRHPMVAIGIALMGRALGLYLV
jgi:hypothetical protein